MKLRLQSGIPKNSKPTRMSVLDSHYFPIEISETVLGKKITDKNFSSFIRFKERLCHECNVQIPEYSYCHEMYGGKFKQTYGWYINKQSFEWGLDPLRFSFLPAACLEEVLNILNDPKFLTSKQLQTEAMRNEDVQVFYEINKKLKKTYRAISNLTENEVRRKFGYKKIGESWTSETILYFLICELFPKTEILRHYRPDFLEGLEIDIYVKKQKLAIEYQGVQHYKAIKHWGGEKALDALKKRDKKKRKS